MPERSVPVAKEPRDPWKEFEGIPLCHVPADENEAEELRRKGVCGPRC